MRKYVLDTNVFIDAFRDPSANAALQRFHLLFAPFPYMSAVVAQELLAGTRTASDRRKLERHVLGIYAQRGRVVAPSQRAWERSGVILADLVRREGSASAKRSATTSCLPSRAASRAASSLPRTLATSRASHA